MYLGSLSLQGYKPFRDPFVIEFSKGLNVLVGENGVGKSAVIDAIRLLLLEDEFGRNLVAETHFFSHMTILKNLPNLLTFTAFSVNFHRKKASHFYLGPMRINKPL